jgi:hypothetical protein
METKPFSSLALCSLAFQSPPYHMPCSDTTRTAATRQNVRRCGLFGFASEDHNSATFIHVIDACYP